MDELRNWVDFDQAELALGRALGLLPKSIASVSDAKALLWSSNEIGNCLHVVLLALVKLGYVLHDERNDKFKINENFSLTSDR